MNTNSAPMPLRVDLVSDVVCPWCIVGYRQLDKALSPHGGGIELDLRWHPFELNPRMPPEGQNLREHVEQKYGSAPGQRREAGARLRALGEELGIAFNLGDDGRIVNTFKAHQLLHWAAERGRQTELKLALFAAYFTDCRDVSDSEVLADAAAAAGLPADTAREVLADARYAPAVRDAERRWLEEGIQAVPCFVVNEQYLVHGAQDAAAFGRMLDKLLARHAQGGDRRG